MKGNRFRIDSGTKTGRLLPEERGNLDARNALRESGIVFHIGGSGQLAFNVVKMMMTAARTSGSDSPSHEAWHGRNYKNKSFL